MEEGELIREDASGGMEWGGYFLFFFKFISFLFGFGFVFWFCLRFGYGFVFGCIVGYWRCRDSWIQRFRCLVLRNGA